MKPTELNGLFSFGCIELRKIDINQLKKENNKLNADCPKVTECFPADFSGLKKVYLPDFSIIIIQFNSFHFYIYPLYL